MSKRFDLQFQFDLMHPQFMQQAFAVPVGTRNLDRSLTLHSRLGALAKRGRVGARRMPDGGVRTQSEEAVVFGLDHAVALARAFLQPGAIDDRDVPAVIADQPRCLELSRRFGDAFAAHPQHSGNRLVGDIELLAGQQIQREQQPAAQLLVHRMVAGAHHALAHLRHLGLRIAQAEPLEDTMLIQLP